MIAKADWARNGKTAPERSKGRMVARSLAAAFVVLTQRRSDVLKVATKLIHVPLRLGGLPDRGVGSRRGSRRVRVGIGRLAGSALQDAPRVQMFGPVGQDENRPVFRHVIDRDAQPLRESDPGKACSRLLDAPGAHFIRNALAWVSSGRSVSALAPSAASFA